MTKNRVAVYRSDLLPSTETFVLQQVRALVNWTPILIGRRKLDGGLDFSDLQSEIVPEWGGRSTRILQRFLWCSEPNLLDVLRRLNVHVVHAHFGVDATDIWPSVRVAGLPLLVTLHGYDINRYRWWWENGHGGVTRRNYPRRLLRMAMDPSVSFIAVSNAIKHKAIEFGIPETKITVNYIGINTEYFNPGELPISCRKKRVVFIGRMVEKKSPLLMIRAFSEVYKFAPDAELIMIGVGPLLDAAKRLAKNLAVPVNFMGVLSSNEVRTQLQHACVLCLPSVEASDGDAEGLGLVLLEAQACGVPVVTSAFGGSSEAVVHGRTGFAHSPGDKDELVRKILSLFRDSSLLDSMSSTAVKFVREKFDTRSLIKELESSYDEMIS